MRNRDYRTTDHGTTGRKTGLAKTADRPERCDALAVAWFGVPKWSGRESSSASRLGALVVHPGTACATSKKDSADAAGQPELSARVP
jgi:hypothetical protein